MVVFVYGTLADPGRAAAVLSEFAYGPRARVDGLRRVDGRYPTLAPGGSVEGRLLRTDELDRLDEYEGVAAGLYVRVELPRAGATAREATADSAGGSGAARPPVQTYVGDPDRLDPVEPVSWPGPGSLAERVRRYVREAGVVVRPVDEA